MRLISSILALLAATVPALADTLEQVSVRVRYGDLDLNAAAGRIALDRRIRTAAKLVCAGQAGHGLAALAFRQQCERSAVDSARSQTARID